MRRKRWSRWDRWNAAFVLGGLFVIVLWLAVPSSLFLRPISQTFEGRVVTFTRELPRGPVRATWAAEIVREDGRECHTPGWLSAYYQPVPGNAVTYEIGKWAWACVDAGPPFYLRTVRWIEMFGWLPLRPIETVDYIVPAPPPPDADEVPTAAEEAAP